MIGLVFFFAECQSVHGVCVCVCFGYCDDVNVDAEEQPSLMGLFRIWVLKERWLIFMHMYTMHPLLKRERRRRRRIVVIFVLLLDKRSHMQGLA